MNDIKLTLEEQHTIRNTWATHVGWRLQRQKDHRKFGAGDYLISYSILSGHVLVDNNGLPRKFRCIHIDEIGIAYIKQISRNGKCLKGAMIIDDGTSTVTYKLDPEYAEHILLKNDDDPFDPLEQVRKRNNEKEKIRRANRKIAFSPKNSEEFFEFFSKFSIGQKFWFGHSLNQVKCRGPVEFCGFQISEETGESKYTIIIKRAAITSTLWYYRYRQNTYYLQEPRYYEQD